MILYRFFTVQGSLLPRINTFSKHILFTTIYLMEKHKLNYRNYSEQEIIMRNFVQATEYDANTYAKIKYIDIYILL
jgi:hypothetical protein